MRYLVLACDYDGTLATHGAVDEATVAALRRLRATGRRLLLVTGRELPELKTVFPHLDLFELVVAENGALLYWPASDEEQTLAAPPPEAFVAELRRRGVAPMSVGRVIVATWHPHETGVLETIRDLGLEMQVIFNKDAVMVLPSGVNKATGLKAALKELGLSAHNVVAVGDAENDHAFLAACECGAAVDNALPMLKEKADIVTRGDHGQGVQELIEEMIATDLKGREDRLTRHHVLLGTGAGGGRVCLRPYGTNVLVAGPSGGGKSVVVAGLLERLAEKRYQFCVIDPQGVHHDFGKAGILGTRHNPPSAEEVLKLIDNPSENAVINLAGLPVTERPKFFTALLPHLLQLRAQTGRPHWIVVGEAHQMLPAGWQPGELAFPHGFDRLLLVTVHPEEVAPEVLELVDTAVAVGPSPEATFARFADKAGARPPRVEEGEPGPGELYIWDRKAARALKVRCAPCRADRLRPAPRHVEGELPPERSFYFRGPQRRLNLRAQTVPLFLQIGEGVDDDTWMHHLRQGDYSRWFRAAFGDEHLAAEVARVETLANVSPEESRKLIRTIVEEQHTLPASAAPARSAADGAHGRPREVAGRS